MSNDDLSSYLYAQRFYFIAEQCLNIMQKSLTRTLRQHDLNHSQHLVLLVLRYAEFSGRDVISTDIAYLLGLEKHSITTVVDKLVHRDLVERERSTNDRRVIHLKLTLAGRDLAAEVQSETVGVVSTVPDHAQDEFVRMCDFLPSLRAHIATSSGQPSDAYKRAYQSLLIDGQAAFLRHHDQNEQ